MHMSAYPHRCPMCGSAAYLGLRLVDCSNRKCRHAGEAARKPGPTNRFICASTAHGGPLCLNEVLVTDGEGTCSLCGSDYSSDLGMNYPVFPP
jgi:hypothetical protein